MKEVIYKINMVESGNQEKELMRWILYTFFDYERIRRGTYYVNREGVKKMVKRLNELFEKYIKTNYKVKAPILKKPDDDIAWCEARVNRKINFDLV